MSNLETKLTSWGAEQRRLPSQNDEVKSVVLTHTPTQASSASRITTARRVPWLSLAFAVFALIAFLAPNLRERLSSPSFLSTPVPMGVARDKDTSFESESLSLGSSASYRVAPAPDFYPRPYPDNPPATDTREYLKTDYGATIRTRRVLDVGNRTATIIRGYDGRIDSSSLSESSGYLSFVLPATKLDVFRTELTMIVGSRFINETLSTQNLLPEKRSIESEQKNATDELNRLESERRALVASFRRKETDLNTRIATASDDNERRALQDELARARRTYENRKHNLDVQIQSNRDILTSLERQTTDLQDNVATVRGSISLQKISWYGVVNTYLHGYTIAFALLMVAIGTHVRYRWIRFPSPPSPLP